MSAPFLLEQSEVKPSLHGAIMNLPCTPGIAMVNATEAQLLAYKIGHRDARHAAADLANEQDAIKQELLEALRIARDYVFAELEHRKQAYDGYPHKWSREVDDLNVVDAAIRKATLGGAS